MKGVFSRLLHLHVMAAWGMGSELLKLGPGANGGWGSMAVSTSVADHRFKIFLRKDVDSVFTSLLACLVSAVRSNGCECTAATSMFLTNIHRRSRRAKRLSAILLNSIRRDVMHNGSRCPSWHGKSRSMLRTARVLPLSYAPDDVQH
jgi:hypothetical protein